MEKNHYIELSRFCASVVIMLHHSFHLGLNTIAPGGWIFVEFFFMLSGYFTTNHFARRNSLCAEREAIFYTLNKIRAIYPMALMGIILGAIYQMLISGISFISLKRIFYSLPSNLLLLGPMKISEFNYNNHMWYLTGIMMTMPIMIILLLKTPSLYKYAICWMFPVLGYVFLISNYGTLSYWGEFFQFSMIIRALCGLMLGSLSYYINEWLGNKTLNERIWNALSILSAIILVLLIYLSFRSDCKDKIFFTVFSSFIFLTLAIDDKCVFNKKIPAWIDKLGALSIAIYCMHGPIFDIIHLYGENLSDRVRLYGGIMFTIIVSTGIMMVTNGLRRNK